MGGDGQRQHAAPAHRYAALGLGARWVGGVWDLLVRAPTPAEEVRLMPLLEAYASPEGPDLALWRDVLADLVVGLRAYEGGGEPAACRLTWAPALVALDQPVPWLPAGALLGPHHVERAAAAVFGLWIAGHVVARHWTDATVPDGCPGDPVPTALGLLSVRPISPQTAGGAYPRAIAAVISTYLLGQTDPDPGEEAAPDFDAMARDAVEAVTHRWDVDAGEWVECSVTVDPDDASDALWGGVLSASDVVRLHNAASRHVVAAADLVAPWSSPRMLGAMPDGSAPFTADCDEYDAAPSAVRLWARMGYAQAWAIEHDRRVSRAMG